VGLAVVKKGRRDHAAHKRTQAAAQSFVYLTRGIEEDFIASIALYQGDTGKRMVLARAGDGWALTHRSGIAARADRVSAFIENMQNIRGETRGILAESFPDFGIGDDEGVHVILQDASGADLAHLVFGVKVPRLGVVFCRQAGSEETLIADSQVPFNLGIHDPESEISDDYFVDWSIYAPVVKEAIRLDVTNPKEKEPFSVIRDQEGAWAFDPPRRRKKVDNEEVEKFLRMLSEIEGRGFFEPVEGVDFGLDVPAIRVVATVLGSQEGDLPRIFDIRVGGRLPEDPDMYFVKVQPQDLIYGIPEKTAEGLIVTREDFTASRRKR